MGTNTTNNYSSYSAELLHLFTVFLNFSAESLFCMDKVKITYLYKDNKINISPLSR